MDRPWVPARCRPVSVRRAVLRKTINFPFAGTRIWSSPGRRMVRRDLTITAAASTKYTVQQGDTLHLIARKFDLTTQDLKNANKSVLYEPSRARIQTGSKKAKVFASDLIFPGDCLSIPSTQGRARAELDQTLLVAVPVSTPATSELSGRQFGGIGGQWLAGFVAVVVLGGVLLQRLTREPIVVIPGKKALAPVEEKQPTLGGTSMSKKKVSKNGSKPSKKTDNAQIKIQSTERARDQRKGNGVPLTAANVSEEPVQSTNGVSPPSVEQKRSSLTTTVATMAPIALASGAKEMEPKKNEQARSDVQSTIIPNWINVLSMNGKKEAREVESTDTEPKTDDSTRLVAPQSTNGVSFNIMDGYEAERVAKLKEALLDINLGSDVSEDQKGAIVEAVIDLETQRKKSTESQILMKAWGTWRLVYTSDSFVKNAARILESTSFMKLEEIFHEVDGATKTVFNKMSVLVPTISGDSQAISVRTSRIGQVRFSHTNGVPEAFLPQILSSLDVDTSDFPTSLSMLGQEINISALQQLFTPVRNGVNAGLESAQSVVSIVERFLPQQLTDFVRSRADKWVRITCVSGDVLVCRDESDEVYILTKVTTGKEGNEATLESQDEVVAVDESDQAVAL